MAKDRDINDELQDAIKESREPTKLRLVKIDDPLDLQDQPEQSAVELQKMNMKHAFILDYHGAPAVMCQIYSVVHHKEITTFTSLQAFKDQYTNQLAPGTKDKLVKLGHWWIDNADRREYATVIFDPNKPPGENELVDVRKGLKVWNAWEGFAVEPKKGTWKKTKKHIYRVLCNGEREKFIYFMKWLAWAIQNPGTRAEVAAAFKGLKGAGKGFIFTQMVRLFGRHGLSISNPEHLSGKHNDHLAYVCFLFADEAYYPGDKSVEGIIKNLITEPFLAIEPKFRSVLQTLNCLHVCMSTNADWVVPASGDERRYFINKVDPMYAKGEASDERRDRYFSDLWGEMNNGGRAHMLYDLQRMKLGDWHPRTSVPWTEELENQQILSAMGSVSAIRLVGEMLENGKFPGEKHEGEYRTTLAELEEHMESIMPQSKKIPMRLKAEVLRKVGARPQRTNKKRYWYFPELGKVKRLFNAHCAPLKWTDYDNWDGVRNDY